MKDDIPLFLTRNLDSPWVWVGRGVLILLIWSLLLTAEKDAAIVFLLPTIILSAGIVGYPKDELGFDQTHLYYIRRSVFRYFTSVERYAIKDITSIKAKLDMKGRYDWNLHRVEITFTDNSSKTLFIRMKKKVLRFVASEVHRLNTEAVER